MDSRLLGCIRPRLAMDLRILGRRHGQRGRISTSAPATVEAGPNVAAPSPNDCWIPGTWVWQQSRYAWRPGVWASVRPDWVWIPAHYVWCHEGTSSSRAIGITRSGVAAFSLLRSFSMPLCIHAAASSTRRRSPSIRACLPISSSCGRVIAATISVTITPPAMRPLASTRRFRIRPAVTDTTRFCTRVGNIATIQAGNAGFMRHSWTAAIIKTPDRRGTFAAQQRMAERTGNSGNRGFVATTSLDQLARRQDSPLRFQPVDKQERQQFLQRGQNIQKFGEDRQRLEVSRTRPPTGTIPKEYEPSRLKLPTSPLASNPSGPLTRDNASAQSREVLKQDFNTRAKPQVRTPTTTNQESLPKFSVEGQSQTKQGFEPRSSLQPETQSKPNVQQQPRQIRSTQGPLPPSKAAAQPRSIPTPEPKSQPRPTPQPQSRAEAQPHPASPTRRPQSKQTSDQDEKPKK